MPGQHVCVCVSNTVRVRVVEPEHVCVRERARLLQTVGWCTGQQLAGLLISVGSSHALPGETQTALYDTFQSSCRQSSSDFLE